MKSPFTLHLFKTMLCKAPPSPPTVRAFPHYHLGRLPAVDNAHTNRLEPDLTLIILSHTLTNLSQNKKANAMNSSRGFFFDDI